MMMYSQSGGKPEGNYRRRREGRRWEAWGGGMGWEFIAHRWCVCVCVRGTVIDLQGKIPL